MCKAARPSQEQPWFDRMARKAAGDPAGGGMRPGRCALSGFRCSAQRKKCSTFGCRAGLIRFGQGIVDHADRASGVIPHEIDVVAVHSKAFFGIHLDRSACREIDIHHYRERDRDVPAGAIFRYGLDGIEHREDRKSAVCRNAGDRAGK